MDNGGRRGGTNTIVNNYNNINWIIRNGATVQPSFSGFTINSLVIGTNSALYPSLGSTINFNVFGNATIQPGGSITTDSGGGQQNSGTGHGSGSPCGSA